MAYSKEQRIINTMSGSTKNQRQNANKDLKLTGSFDIPNKSGDHVRSIKRDVPVNGYDLTNKDYVDAQIAGENHWDDNGTQLEPYIENRALKITGTGDSSFAGKVGIGTDSPLRKLQIQTPNSDNNGIMLNRLTTDVGDNVGLYFSLTTNPSVSNNQFGAIKGIRASGMALYDGGNIGTLQETMRLFNGKVGIGTDDPSKKLDISGDGINLDNTTTNDTGIIWKNGDRFIHNFQHPTGDTAVPVGNNTFVGIDVGNFTMGYTATSTAHASYNTGIGYKSLYSNTTGYRNTGIGYASLHSNTTGYQNTGIGYLSLYYNTTGYYNTGIGNYSLQANTTGYYNTGIGYEAGRYIADGTTANETSTNSVYLGTDTKALADGDTNEIVIGYDATGLGSNTAVIGNDDITKTEIKGRLINEGTFSEIYVADASTAQTIATGTTYTKVTPFTTNGQNSNCTADQANDKITFTKTGRYFVTAKLNGYVDTANTQFDMALFLDGTIQNNIKAYVEFAAANKDGEITVAGIVDVDSTDEDLDVRVRHDDVGNVDITIINANITAQYLGET